MALREIYGVTKDNQEVEKFILQNKNGLAVHCINYGCCLTSILVPDSSGGTEDVLLGYDSLSGYEYDTSYQGALVGRYANRIKAGEFEIEGKKYSLTKNDSGNYLHGSLNSKVFDAELIGDNSISFTYTSPEGEDGFPGELWVGIIYTLTDENELVMDYRAVPRAATHVNLSNHAYYNMSGQNELSVSEQTLWLNSSSMLETGQDLCPTGRVIDISGGAFDFTEAKPIGRDIGKDDPQLQVAGGYDHCFILDKSRPSALSMAAIARDPVSGRTMRVYTTQPAVQFYSGNFLDSSVAGKNGRPFAKRSGFCLETQHYPCSPNIPDFPTTLLEAGEKYHNITVHQFSW